MRAFALIATVLALAAMTVVTFAQAPFNPGLLGQICPGLGALCQPVPAAGAPCGNGTLDFTTGCGTTFYVIGVT
jgi:hypothetical protein